MLHSVEQFTGYYDGIRRRTVTYVQAVPQQHLDWSPAPGEFTCADLVRHLAAAEQMFIGAIVHQHWHYPGHTTPVLATVADLQAHLAATHQQAMQALRMLPDAELGALRPTIDGPQVPAWRLLMALVEHEVHHRSQLAMYLTLLGTTPPHIFGLGVEDVIARLAG